MSGKAFHSGRLAFSVPRDLYILGLNPGGDPEDRSETVASNVDQVRHKAEDWCAFLDQDWRPGGRYYGQAKAPLQMEMQELAACLGLDLRRVPASDVFFTRARQAHHTVNQRELVDLSMRGAEGQAPRAPRLRALPCEGQAPRAPRLRALPCEGQTPRAPRLRALAGHSTKRSSKVSVSVSCSACTRGRPSSCGRRSEPVRDPSIGSASGHAPGGNTGGRLSPLRAGSRSYRSLDRQASHGCGMLAC